jgi:PPOX class probable F420-dependent enzyme
LPPPRRIDFEFSPDYTINMSLIFFTLLSAQIIKENYRMSNTIPESHLVLFEKPILASLATTMPDGKIQVNPVWCDFDGTHVRVNSAAGRQKDKNLKEREVATVLLVDPENGFFWLEVRGRLEEATTDGADDHIDALAKKYLGVDSYPFRDPGEVRVVYKIKPERVMAFQPPQ